MSYQRVLEVRITPVSWVVGCVEYVVHLRLDQDGWVQHDTLSTLEKAMMSASGAEEFFIHEQNKYFLQHRVR